MERDMLTGLIGPVDEKWDICFIAEYPSVESFISMQIMRLIGKQ